MPSSRVARRGHDGEPCSDGVLAVLGAHPPGDDVATEVDADDVVGVRTTPHEVALVVELFAPGGHDREPFGSECPRYIRKLTYR